MGLARRHLPAPSNVNAPLGGGIHSGLTSRKSLARNSAGSMRPAPLHPRPSCAPRRSSRKCFGCRVCCDSSRSIDQPQIPARFIRGILALAQPPRAIGRARMSRLSRRLAKIFLSHDGPLGRSPAARGDQDLGPASVKACAPRPGRTPASGGVQCLEPSGWFIRRLDTH